MAKVQEDDAVRLPDYALGTYNRIAVKRPSIGGERREMNHLGQSWKLWPGEQGVANIFDMTLGGGEDPMIRIRTGKPGDRYIFRASPRDVPPSCQPCLSAE